MDEKEKAAYEAADTEMDQSIKAASVKRQEEYNRAHAIMKSADDAFDAATKAARKIRDEAQRAIYSQFHP